MNDEEIKVILNYFRKYATIRENTMITEIEDYITKLKQNQSGFTLENYTRLLNDYQSLKQENRRLKQQLDESFMKKYPMVVENGIICMKNEIIENYKLNHKKAIDEIKSFQVLGFRNGKTIISEFLNNLLKTLEEDNKE